MCGVRTASKSMPRELQVLRAGESMLRDVMPVIVFEINDTLLQASGASRQSVGSSLRGLGYALFRVDEGDVSHVSVATLRDERSEDFFAVPASRTNLKWGV